MQLLLLQRRFPEGAGIIARSRLVWDQSLQPHALAHRYQCRLEHKLQGYPSLCCLDPALSVLADGRTLPHVNSRMEPVEMCLFMRNSECWNDGMVLADIVLPLAFYWLAHFEDWLYSGVWRGGGTHPIPTRPPKRPPIFPGDPGSPGASGQTAPSESGAIVTS
jgi:hypothetical protein